MIFEDRGFPKFEASNIHGQYLWLCSIRHDATRRSKYSALLELLLSFSPSFDPTETENKMRSLLRHPNAAERERVIKFCQIYLKVRVILSIYKCRYLIELTFLNIIVIYYY